MDDKQKLLWIEGSRKLLNECRIFDLYETEKVSPEGGRRIFFLLDSPDWATIIPLLREPDGSEYFVMVEQYRHGSNSLTIEFPAGLLDPGENPETAAGRELLEETGYRAGKLIELGSVSPNPAFMNNRTHTFLAAELEYTGERDLDGDEYIHIHRIPVQEVNEKMGKGQYCNGIMLMALAMYNKWKESEN